MMPDKIRIQNNIGHQCPTCRERRNTNMNLKNRHFLKLLDFTSEEITAYLDLAAELKAAKKQETRCSGCREKHRPDFRENIDPHPLRI